MQKSLNTKSSEKAQRFLVILLTGSFSQLGLKSSSAMVKDADSRLIVGWMA
jgi:hypothetical protein